MKPESKMLIDGRCLRSLAAVAALLLAGCSLLDPHFQVPRAQVPDPTYAGDLGTAISEADILRLEYQQAVGEQSIARSSLALTLVPLSAATLAVGITGGAGIRDFMTGAAAGGAALFGLGSLFVDSNRQRIYLAGSVAITCATWAMAPVQVTTADFLGEKVDVRELGSAVAAADGKADPALLDRARTELAAARLLLAQISTSGFALRQQLNLINSSVSLQLVKTEPDVSAILAAATGLKKTAAAVEPGFGGGAVTTQGGSSLVRTAEQRLLIAMDRVAGWLGMADAIDHAFSALSLCYPAAATGGTALEAALRLVAADATRPAEITTSRDGTISVRLGSSGSAAPPASGTNTRLAGTPASTVTQNRSPAATSTEPALRAAAAAAEKRLLERDTNTFGDVLVRLAIPPTQFQTVRFHTRVKQIQATCFSQIPTGFVDEAFLAKLLASKPAPSPTACPEHAETSPPSLPPASPSASPPKSPS